MMMGPAPMIMMDWISVRLGIFSIDQVYETLEKILAVLRTGACLGMILHGEDRTTIEADAFDDIIKKGFMRFRDAVRQAFARHDKAVVLRGDLDPAGDKILDRLVAAAMALMHLDGFRADREGQHLMAEADAENRHAAVDTGADNRHRIFARRNRIARPVGEKDPIGLQC